uniref:FBA_2 domain-containing protein n=1 Tax=Caenorhabditis tropicalis TaxID=1561998 RepID=A0A1I7UYP3_9PELO
MLSETNQEFRRLTKTCPIHIEDLHITYYWGLIRVKVDSDLLKATQDMTGWNQRTLLRIHQNDGDVWIEEGKHGENPLNNMVQWILNQKNMTIKNLYLKVQTNLLHHDLTTDLDFEREPLKGFLQKPDLREFWFECRLSNEEFEMINNELGTFNSRYSPNPNWASFEYPNQPEKILQLCVVKKFVWFRGPGYVAGEMERAEEELKAGFQEDQLGNFTRDKDIWASEDESEDESEYQSSDDE